MAELWRVYIVERGYIRDPEWRVTLSRLHCILQATSLCERRKSATATHVEQQGFVLSRSKLLLHNSLHFQHLMRTKGYSFETTTVKKKPRQ